MIYISRIDYDPMSKHLVVEVLGDPESPDILRILTFTGVEDFTDEKVDDEDGSTIDSLVGLDEFAEQGVVRYVFHTENREMSFRTSEEPHVREYP